MKVTIKSIQLNGNPQTLHGQRCVRAVAIISKSVKKGIPKRFQKTWSLPTVAPTASAEELKPVIWAEARRWEKKIMDRIEAEKKLESSGTPNVLPA